MVMRINSFMTGLGAIVLAALLAACSAQYDAMDEPAGAPPEPAVEAPEPAPIDQEPAPPPPPAPAPVQVQPEPSRAAAPGSSPSVTRAAPYADARTCTGCDKYHCVARGRASRRTGRAR